MYGSRLATPTWLVRLPTERETVRPSSGPTGMRLMEEARELLEAEARRRAAMGVEEPVFYKGQVVGHIRKYSDNLLMFLLKAHWPEKFRENLSIDQRVSGSDGGPVKTEHVFQPTQEAWDEALRTRAEYEALRDGDTDEDTASDGL